MLASIARYANDAVGVEKTLRLIQSFAQVAAASSSSSSDAASWSQLRSQMIVPRRFLRITKWIDAWQIALQQLQTERQHGVRTLLSVTKFSCLGIYFFLEMFTITDAMNITKTSWGPGLLQESLKFWFYALIASILLSVFDLWTLWTSTSAAASVTEKDSGPSKIGNGNSADGVSKTMPPNSITLCRRILVDGCDILIPGSAVGWISADPAVVGTAGCVSSLLAMRDVWSRVNGGLV